MCIKVLDELLGSLQDIDALAGTPQHEALRQKLLLTKAGFEFPQQSGYIGLKQKEHDFGEFFFGQITDNLLSAVETGELVMAEDKVWDSEDDMVDIMANVFSKYLSTAYKIEKTEDVPAAKIDDKVPGN